MSVRKRTLQSITGRRLALRYHRVRAQVSLLALPALALAGGRPAAAQGYSFTLLTAPGSGPLGTFPQRINSSNLVVGFSTNSRGRAHAFLWAPDANGRFGPTAAGRALPEPRGALGSEALAVTSAGLIVGDCTVPDPHHPASTIEHAAAWMLNS